MRHLGSLIAAIVIAPLAWVLFAIGQTGSLQAFDPAQGDTAVDTTDLVRAAPVLAAAGILLGLLGSLRFSPAGPLLAGVLYAGMYLAMLARPSSVLRLLDHTVTVAGQRGDLAVPARTGTSLLVGAVLLVAVLSIHRWRRWPRPATDDTETKTPPGPAASTESADRPLGVDGLGLTPADGSPGAAPTAPPERTPQPVGMGATHWVNSLRSSSDALRGNSDLRR